MPTLRNTYDYLIVSYIRVAKRMYFDEFFSEIGGQISFQLLHVFLHVIEQLNPVVLKML